MSIDIQSAVMNELFALYPIIIQGWVAPVKPDGSADGGISKALHDGHVLGLECLVDPLLELQMRGGTMAADDRVDLYVNDDTAAVDGKTVALGEEQQRIRLYVPHGYLRQGVNRLYYKVTRVGGNVEPSRDLHVLYHLRLPDSLDLVIRADVLKEGVDSEKAAQGVEFGFTYNNRRPYDRIEFLLGDATFRFDVPDAPAAVTYTLFTDGFQKAGDNPKAVAEFFVTDQLGNRSKSPEKRLDIHLARLDLDLLAPTVKGMTGNSFSPTQPELRVLVPPGKLLPSDQVSVTWKGATATAQGSYTSPLRLVSAGLEIAVPRSVLAYSLGKAVTVSYSVVRNGQTLPSLALTLNILALPASALNPPKIVEADVNNFLDIIKLGTSNATIHGLLWTLIEVGQQVWLKLEGKKADGTTHNLTVWKGGGSNVNATWVNQGFWPKPLLNSYLKALGDGSTLTLKFKAALDKSNVEANAVVFPDRVYTIMSVALIAPTLTDVTDAKGNKVPNGGTTAETSVTLTGTANKGLEVEIFDGTVSKGKATADPVTGIWSLLVSGLSVTAHSFTAKALYGSGESSTAWTFTVVALATPVISLVKDAKNVVVPNGGTTFETSVTLTGTAPKGQEVEIFDGTVSKGKATADLVKGVWNRAVSGLSVATHRFTAKALYGSGASSNVRTLSVQVRHPTLELNTSPINESRTLYVWANMGPNDLIFFQVARQATRGVPPYTYKSSNPAVINVNSATGRVTVLAGGNATISVSDSVGQSKSYTISISGRVLQCVDLGRGTYPQISTNAANQGVRIPDWAELEEIDALYSSVNWPIDDTPLPGGTWGKSYYSSGTQYLIVFMRGSKPAGNTSSDTLRFGVGLR